MVKMLNDGRHRLGSVEGCGRDFAPAKVVIMATSPAASAGSPANVSTAARNHCATGGSDCRSQLSSGPSASVASSSANGAGPGGQEVAIHQRR